MRSSDGHGKCILLSNHRWRKAVPICSYLVHALPGRESAALKSLNQLPGCEATLSHDQQALLLVTETESETHEERLRAQIGSLCEVLGTTLVFAANQDSK